MFGLAVVLTGFGRVPVRGFEPLVAVTADPVSGRAVLSPATIARQSRGGALPVEVGEDAKKESEKERHVVCVEENGARLK